VFRSTCRRALLAAGIGLLFAYSAVATPAPPTPMRIGPGGHPGTPSRDDFLTRRLERPALTAARLVSDSLDAHWLSGFGLAVPDDYISSLLPFGNVLVAGGGFRRIGGLQAPGLATWDGAHWALIGNFPGNAVFDLAPYPGGFVAIGPSYNPPAVWRWTGTAWETWAIPGAISDPIALAVLGDQVAIASNGNIADSLHGRVMLKTSQGWTTLGEDFDEQIESLAWFQGRLYVGGRFRHVGGVAAAMVAVWDGTSWHALPQELPHGPFDGVRTLAVYRGELVAAGSFADPAPRPVGPNFFARWDGTRWAGLGMGSPQYPNLTRLRVIDNDLYALGTFAVGYPAHGISRWDGATWHQSEDELQAFVWDVAVFHSELHAGGALSNSGGWVATPLVRREGAVWEPTVADPGGQGLLGWSGPDVNALAATDQGVVAGGRFDFAGMPGGWRRCFGAALWNGHEWAPLGFEDWAFAEPGALVIHKGALHAIGWFSNDSGSCSVVQYTGAGWRFVENGYGGQPFANAYRGVSAFGELFIGGNVNSWDRFGGVARWDGSTWRGLGRGITRGSYITGMVEHQGELVVSGWFQEVDGVPCANVAAWSPASGWHALGGGLEGSVNDLLSRDGVLYAAGSFRLPSDPYVGAGLARWRDGHWEAMRMPVSDAYRLGWYRDQLVVSSGGWIATLQADGTWRPLGSGTDGAILAMVESHGSLFVGGYFSRAGAAPAYGFAAWSDGPGGPPVAVAPAMTSLPNPFAKGVHLRYELPAAAHAKVEMFDLAGHRVDTVFDGAQSAGAQDVAWSPSAARVKAGVYYARLTIGASTSVVSVVRVP